MSHIEILSSMCQNKVLHELVFSRAIVKLIEFTKVKINSQILFIERLKGVPQR